MRREEAADPQVSDSRTRKVNRFGAAGVLAKDTPASQTELLRFLGPVACRLQPHRSKHPGPRVDQAPVDSRRPAALWIQRVKARLGADRCPTIARVIDFQVEGDLYAPPLVK